MCTALYISNLNFIWHFICWSFLIKHFWKCIFHAIYKHYWLHPCNAYVNWIYNNKYRTRLWLTKILLKAMFYKDKIAERLSCRHLFEQAGRFLGFGYLTFIIGNQRQSTRQNLGNWILSWEFIPLLWCLEKLFYEPISKVWYSYKKGVEEITIRFFNISKPFSTQPLYSPQHLLIVLKEQINKWANK